MIGADLDQIEARVTAQSAWPFDGGQYWHIIESTGDIHQYNADLIESDRDTAKGFQYAIYYGAGPPKLAAILGCSEVKAKRYIKDFWEGNKGVYILKEQLAKMYKRYGFIVGIDGRKIRIRAEYKLLNSKIQTDAGIIWKQWGVLANERMRQNLIDCHQIIAYHDEYQYDCEEIALPLAKSIIETAATDAGRSFNMNVPITAETKVGRTWADTH
jgi:DNA polymerase-1